MTNEMLASALNEGTPSWEVTIVEVLSLALQSATCARAGDLARSYGYEKMEALVWGDVQMFLPPPTSDTLPEGFTTPAFNAYITLKWRKGKK